MTAQGGLVEEKKTEATQPGKAKAGTSAGKGGDPAAGEGRVLSPQSKQRRGMSAKAEILAKRLAGTQEQFTRVRGFVANGNLDPKFCGAVCARLLSKLSVDSLRRSGGNPKESRLLYDNLKIWALKTDPEVERKSREVASGIDEATQVARDIRDAVGRSSTEALAELGRTESGVQAEHIFRIGGEALLLNGPCASLLVEKKVCAYCLAAELLNVEVREIDLSRERQGEAQTLDAVRVMILAGSNGASLAMARAHNKEMHALNGNIHMIHAANTPRTDVVGTAVTRASQPVKHAGQCAPTTGCH